MDTALKVVTQIPLKELWRDDGFTTTSRVRWLVADDIMSLLRAGRVQFVVAEVGASPRWIPLDECYDFWKTEAQPHLVGPESRASLVISQTVMATLPPSGAAVTEPRLLFVRDTTNMRPNHAPQRTAGTPC